MVHSHIFMRGALVFIGVQNIARDTHAGGARCGAHLSRPSSSGVSHATYMPHVIIVDYTSITTGNVAVTSARKSAAAVVTGGGTPLTADAVGVA